MDSPNIPNNGPAQINTTPGEIPRDIISTITSIKEIVTIITGLTITRTIIQLLTINGGLSLIGCLEGCPEAIGVLPLLLFILLLMNVVRFYHGNMRHLDTTYSLIQGAGDVHLNSGKRTASD